MFDHGQREKKSLFPIGGKANFVDSPGGQPAAKKATGYSEEILCSKEGRRGKAI